MIADIAVRGLTVKLDVQSGTERFRADTYAGKEPETLTWIDRYFRAGETFFDVGANIGLYSLYAALRAPGLKVYAFEPESLNFAKLNVNVLANGLSGTVLPVCAAVAGRVCFDVFNLNPAGFDMLEKGEFQPGTALHNFGAAVDYKGEAFTPFHRQGALGVTLDHLCYGLGLPVPAHLKVDVDGLEEEIFQGAKRLLADEGLRTVLVEVSASRDVGDEVYQAMIAAGFEVDDDYPEHSFDQLKGTQFEDCRNTVFVRAGKDASTGALP